MITPLAERLIGAKICDVSEEGPAGGLLKIELVDHAEADSWGFLIVALGSIYFNDGGFPDV